MYLFFGIYYFIPFVRKKNFTIYYNTINENEFDKYKLNISISSISIKLKCDKDNEQKNITNVTEYFNLNARYYTKKGNNKTYENLTFIDSTLSSKNVTKKMYTIGGEYNEDKFQYIEISLNSKNNTSEYISEIDRLLFKDDCQLEFYYNDYTSDYDKFEEPFTKVKNEIFLQLNPYFNVKMNAFFMRQTLADDHDILFDFEDDENEKNIFSRSEQYFLYKGNYNTKEENRPKDNGTYASIYIRADSKRI